MLPVAGFIPSLPPPRAREPGPARHSRTSQPAALANPDSPRQPHFRDAPPSDSEHARMPASREATPFRATPSSPWSLRGCSQHSRPRQPFPGPASLVETLRRLAVTQARPCPSLTALTLHPRARKLVGDVSLASPSVGLSFRVLLGLGLSLVLGSVDGPCRAWVQFVISAFQKGGRGSLVQRREGPEDTVIKRRPACSVMG